MRFLSFLLFLTFAFDTRAEVVSDAKVKAKAPPLSKANHKKPKGKPMNSLALLQTVQTFWRDNGKSVAKDEKEFVFYGEIINLKSDEMKMSRYQMTAEKIDRKSFDEKTYVGYTYENIFGNNENIPKTGDFYLVKWHSPGVIDRGFEFVLNEKASNVILMRRYLSPD